MSMNDPIADMLTRIRNANLVGRESVDMFSSVIKVGMVKVMKDEGFITNYKEIVDGPKKTLRIYLKYGSMGKKVINHLERESKCGKRVYKQVSDIVSVLGGIGINIFSTSKGILSGSDCKKNNIGGELLCTVW